jgi:hypothetical protein
MAQHREALMQEIDGGNVKNCRDILGVGTVTWWGPLLLLWYMIRGKVKAICNLARQWEVESGGEIE